jgi:hypothetical protein
MPEEKSESFSGTPHASTWVSSSFVNSKNTYMQLIINPDFELPSCLWWRFYAVNTYRLWMFITKLITMILTMTFKESAQRFAQIAKPVVVILSILMGAMYTCFCDCGFYLQRILVLPNILFEKQWTKIIGLLAWMHGLGLVDPARAWFCRIIHAVFWARIISMGPLSLY